MKKLQNYFIGISPQLTHSYLSTQYADHRLESKQTSKYEVTYKNFWKNRMLQ